MPPTLTPRGPIYQSTDLARRSREVMDAAHRPGGALIRDKDGTSFLLAPAVTSQLESYVLAALRSTTRVLLALQTSRDQRDPLYYADLVWLAVLPDTEQRTFVGDYTRALEQVEATGIEPVEQLLYEWRQTARIWPDEQLRRELSADIDDPLVDPEL